MSRVMDVIVIGCGASGIAALTMMYETGLTVLGLEAADRIGGRICTVPFGDNVVDLGAAWCHGEVDNLVYELANPYKLLGKSEPYHTQFLLSNGEKIESDVADDISEAVKRIIDTADKDSTSISECIRNGINKTKFREHSLTDSFLEWYERNNHLGGQLDPRNGKSMKGLEEQWICSGDFMQHWKGRGFKTILDIMLKKLPNSEEELKIPILLKKKVVTIKWKANQPDLAPESPLVHVMCRDGSLYAARRVLVTISIGVLKEITQWASNPLTRGAYSYRSVATENNGCGAEMLSVPLYREAGIPIVCFGGEATSHHRHGAVHGAIEAGYREAKRIIDSFK